MIRTMVVAIALAAPAVLASAQTGQTYPGVITGDDVYVRSGAGNNHYPVIKLSRGDRVTVVGRRSGWLAIEPPAGVFSLVAKRYVDVEGTDGTVNADRVNIRAGSIVEPSSFSRVQGQMNAGGRVRVVGQTEEHYKIAPPGGALMYVSPEYVKLIDKAEAEAPQAPDEASASRPATRPTSRPASRPASRPSISDARRAVEAFEAAEKLLAEEFAKAADERDLKTLVEAYQAVDAPDDSAVAAKVDYRLRYLDRVRQRLEGAKRVAELAEAAKRQRVRIAEMRAKLATKVVRLKADETFTVSGRLSPSKLFLGDGVAPKRYLVKDEASGDLLAYAEAGDATVDLDSMSGWHVVLAGRKSYNASLHAYIIEVFGAEKVAGGEPIQEAAPPAFDAETVSFPKPWPKPKLTSSSDLAKPEAKVEIDFGADLPAPAVEAPEAPAEVDADEPALPTTGLPMNPATRPAPTEVDPAEYQ